MILVTLEAQSLLDRSSPQGDRGDPGANGDKGDAGDKVSPQDSLRTPSEFPQDSLNIPLRFPAVSN